MRNGPDPDKEEPGTRAAFLSLLFGMPPAARKAPALAPANDQRPVNARGQEYEAERLTGNRAQKGKLPGGEPCLTYEVVWKGNHRNTYEPAACLVGWEAEMKKVDEKYDIAALFPRINPAAEANKAREMAAKKKAEELKSKRERLMRLKARRERMGNAGVASDDDEEEEEEADQALGDEELAAELEALGRQLQMLTGGAAVAAAVAAALGEDLAGGSGANGGVAQGEVAAQRSHKREGRSNVWKAFNRETNRCTLPHPSGDAGRVCNAPPERGSGTSGHIRHLEAQHRDEWLHIKVTGERKTSTQMIADAFAAKLDESKPALGNMESNELDRLVARWIAKCGRPQTIGEDQELRELLARILELCKARYRYNLPHRQTVQRHLQLLGAEGKGIAHNFLVRCLKAGVKISITGDLWSENGMGLFGIYAHGMPKFKMEKVLISLVACESERHTAVNIEKWTEQALKDIGLKVPSLLGTAAADDLVTAVTLERLERTDLERLGIDADAPMDADPNMFIFKKISDNGANIKVAWDDEELWAPCIDHTIELCTLPFTYVQKRKSGVDAPIPKGSVAESFSKARGLIGYLHHSTIGLADFHACQKRVGLAENVIEQDVKTRWRTAHNMADEITYNKSAVLEMDKDPKYKDPGEVWGKNKLSFVDWDHLEEGSACLMEAAVGSQLTEGDEYPTSSLVVPTVYRLMAYSAESHDVYFRNRDEDEYNDAATNPVTVSHSDLQPKVQEARKAYHQRLIDRFDADLPLTVKKFWFIASMCDPRFKKLTFEGDNMLKPAARREAVRWFSEEYNNKYKGSFAAAASPSPPTGKELDGTSPVEVGTAAAPVSGEHVKRRKVSSASFFAPRVAGAAQEAAASPASHTRAEDAPHADELAAYLALPQIDWQTEWDGLTWWEQNAKKFPNLSVMARQYLGCPASSATVERLFSQVGIAFSKLRKNAEPSTIADILFTKLNVP